MVECCSKCGANAALDMGVADVCVQCASAAGSGVLWTTIAVVAAVALVKFAVARVTLTGRNRRYAADCS